MSSSESNNMTPKQMLDKYTQLYKTVDRVGVAYALLVPKIVQNKHHDMSVMVRVNSCNIVDNMVDNKKHLFDTFTSTQIKSIVRDVARYFSEFITFAKAYVHFYPNISERNTEQTYDHGIMYEIIVRLEVIKIPMISNVSVVLSFELSCFEFDDQDRRLKVFKTVHKLTPGPSDEYRKFLV